jgi:hypothetical protein
MIRNLVINQELNESTADYVAKIDATLVFWGPLGIQDVFLTRRLDYNTVRYACTIVIAEPGPAVFRAAYFERTITQTVEAQVDAFFAANPTYRAVFVRDVSQEVRRRLDRDSVMILYIASLVPNCGQDRSRPVIVQAILDIAPGATGQVSLVTALGLAADVFEVTNRSGVLWEGGERGYAQVAPGTCAWVGFRTSCDPVPPENLVPPSIEGTAYEGYEMSVVSLGVWAGTGNTYTWEWQRNGVTIPGTTDAMTYMGVYADNGAAITILVSATNSLGGPVAEPSNALEQWIPTDLPYAMPMWYDPADASTVTVVAGRISQVDNKAAATPDAVQGTGSAQPLYSDVNGIGAIECDTFGKSLEIGSLGFNQNQTWSLLYGTSSPYAYSVPVSGRCQISGVGGRFSFTRESAAPQQLVQRPGAASFPAAPQLPASDGVGAHTHTKPATVGGNINQVTSYQNGSGPSTYSGSVAVTFADANNSRINAVAATGNRGTCTYLDVILVLGVLTDSEREKWEGYEAWKYHDTSNLPLSHPYKHVAPTP